MLNATQKNKIINSYSIVLCDVLAKEAGQSWQSVLDDIKNSFGNKELAEQLNIKPTEYKEYKDFLQKLADKTSSKDELTKFLAQVIKRRYGYLIPEITEQAEKKMRKIHKVKNIVITSKSELSQDIRAKVEENIKQQGVVANVEYKVNEIMDEKSIEFSCDSKICVLNIDNLINQTLIVK